MQIAKRVSDMQAKIVETVVGSMLRDSKLTMDKDANHRFVVVDGAARKELNELASGESGRPSSRPTWPCATQTATAEKPTLNQLLASRPTWAAAAALARGDLTQPGASSGSLTELSHPANCYFVSLRADAIAAIRVAHERLNVELGMRGVARRIHVGARRGRLAHAVDALCRVLRPRAGASALVDGHLGHVRFAASADDQLGASAHHPRAAGARGLVYANGVAVPALRARRGACGRNRGRTKAMSAGERIEDIDVGHAMTRAAARARAAGAAAGGHPPLGVGIQSGQGGRARGRATRGDKSEHFTKLF